MSGTQDLDNLINWAIQNGSVIDPRVKFEYTKESGISAFYNDDNDINNEDILIQVSKDCIITPLVALKFFQETTKIEKIDNYSKYYVQLLKYFIAYIHKNSNDSKINHWKPYFNCLPRENKDFNIPLTWPIDELEFFEGTNMLSGVKLKIVQLFEEYLNISNFLKIDISNEINDIKDLNSFTEIYEALLKDESKNNDVGFQEYLYGHQILTSRSFPYRFIEPQAPLDSVMLLPIVDLLNHQPNRKVYWEGTDLEGFKITLPINEVEKNGKRQELFNNYGPKGNEELLMGYGFVIDKNSFDSLTLSLNLVNLKRANLLDDEIDNELMKNWGIKLFSLSDYTFNISENKEISSGTDDNDNEMIKIPDQVVYICNKDHIIPDGLLELFTYISRDLHTETPTLSSKLKGLVSLRDSITTKYKGKLDHLNNVSNCNENHKQLSKIYKEGQLMIYNLMLKELKNIEKKLLNDYRKELITMRDIFKKENDDSVFKKLIINDLKFPNDSNDLDYAESFTIWLIWLLKVVNYSDLEVDDNEEYGLIPEWILPLFEQFKTIQTDEDSSSNDDDEDDEEIQNLKMMYKKLNPFTKELHGNHWDFKSYIAVCEMFQQFSYEKGSKRERILICPIILDTYK